MKKVSLIIAVTLIALLLAGCDSKEESAVKAAVKRKFQYTANLRNWDNYRIRKLTISREEVDMYFYGIDLYGWENKERWIRVRGIAKFERGSWAAGSYHVTYHY